MLAPLVSCNLLGQYAGSDSLEVAINGRLRSIDFFLIFNSRSSLE